MTGVCAFCHQNRELTVHHIMAQSYNGPNTPDNLIPNICRTCHDALENNMNQNRSLAGAGRDFQPQQNFVIGNVTAQLRTGSTLLDQNGLASVTLDSAIYGMRIHHQQTGENYIEAAMSGNDVAIIAGSPANGWVVFSIAHQ